MIRWQRENGRVAWIFGEIYGEILRERDTGRVVGIHREGDLIGEGYWKSGVDT